MQIKVLHADIELALISFFLQQLILLRVNNSSAFEKMLIFL